jgi:hypothetical protein
MTAPAFTKFDPRAFLQNEERRGAAAKVAKPAKASELQPEASATFATFATFAGGHVETQNFELAPETWMVAQEERAAIAEYDGGAPRAWAEALARLDPACPPGDISPKRWLRFINDCGHFLDDGWALRAAELGWTPFDLFGCDRSKPFARIGRSGLLWLLAGQQLRMLTADTAIINTASGSSLTFYRRPREPGQALVWEIAP